MSEIKYEIWVDSRECSTSTGIGILAELQRLGMNTHVENLGEDIDYIIPALDGTKHLFQRKGAYEMMKPRKAYDDIRGMKMIDNAIPFILLEGPLDWISKHTKMKPPPVIGGINSILLDWDTKILPCPNKEWTPMWLYQWAKKVGTIKVKKPLSLGESVDRELPMHEKARKVLETFPDIGPNLAIRILEKFGTLRNALANLEFWREIDGIASGKIHNIRDVLDAQWVSTKTVISQEPPITVQEAVLQEPRQTD